MFSAVLAIVFVACISTRAPSWQGLANKAIRLREAGKADSAASVAWMAFTLYEKEVVDPDTAHIGSLWKIADCFGRAYDYDEYYRVRWAIVHCLERQFGANDKRVLEALCSLGYSYSSATRFGEAVSIFHQVLERLQGTVGPDSSMLVAALLGLSHSLLEQGSYLEAESSLTRAFLVLETKSGPNVLDSSYALHELAMLRMEQGLYAAAESLQIQSLHLFADLPESAQTGAALHLNDLGLIYDKMGRYVEAESLYVKAMKLWEQEKDFVAIASSCNNLGGLCYEQGRYAEALQYHERALRLRRRSLGPDHTEVAGSLNHLGVLYCDYGRYLEAEEAFNEALEIREKTVGARHWRVGQILSNEAKLCQRQGLCDEAELFYRRALQVLDSALGSHHPEVAKCLADLGSVYQMQGRSQEALQTYQRAYEIATAALGPDHPDVATCMSGLAVALQDEGYSEDAAKLEMQAYDIRLHVFQNGFETLTEAKALECSELLRDEAGVYLSILCGSPESVAANTRSIADIVLGSKGIVTDGLAARNRTLAAENDEDIACLATALHSARSLLAWLYVRDSDEKHPEIYRDELSTAVKEKESWESQMVKLSARYRQEREFWNVNAKRISQALPSGSVLIEYMRYDHRKARGEVESRYLAVVINHHDRIFVRSLGSAAPIDSMVTLYQEHFRNSQHFEEKEYREEYKKISEHIYHLTLEPLEDIFRRERTIFIAPDGLLNLVSFGGLLDKGGEYLIERHAISYLCSGRDLLGLEATRPKTAGLLAMGDPDFDAPAALRSVPCATAPEDGSLFAAQSGLRNAKFDHEMLCRTMVSRLPKSRHEIEEAVDTWYEEQSEPAVICLDAQASEENFKRESPGKRVIYLATHAFCISAAEPADPAGAAGDVAEASCLRQNPLLSSGLFLAGANLHGADAESLGADDGLLTAEEVAAMDLQGTELVILSGCETGLGELRSGEGVYGLRRAFQMAGARIVVSALWPVADQATTDFMRRLYPARRGNLALQMQDAAIRYIAELRNSSRSDHPFSWAAFVVFGDWRIR